MDLLRLLDSRGSVFTFLSPRRPGSGARSWIPSADSSQELPSTSHRPPSDRPDAMENELQEAFPPSSSSSLRDGGCCDDRMPCDTPRDPEAHEPFLDAGNGQEEAEEESLVQCRICLESEGGQLIAPCSCKGSSKYVHRECLDRWRSVKEGKAFSQCTTCKERFYLSVQQPRLGARATKFGCLVTRDTLLLVALAQLCICLYAFGAFYIDSAMGSPLRISCGIRQRSVLLFYYLFGLFIFLFVAGLLGRQLRSVQREQHTLVVLTVRHRRRQRRRRALLSTPPAPSASGAVMDVPAVHATGESDADTYQGQAPGRVHLSPPPRGTPSSSWWGQHTWGVPGAGREGAELQGPDQGSRSTDPDTLEAAQGSSDMDLLLAHGQVQAGDALGAPGAIQDVEAGVEGSDHAGSGMEEEESAALRSRRGGAQGVYRGARHGASEDEEAREGEGEVLAEHGQGDVSGGEGVGAQMVGDEGVWPGEWRREGERGERGQLQGRARRIGGERAERESQRAQEERQVLLRFRHTLEVTPEAVFAGSFVAFFVGFLAVAIIELGVVQHKLDGFFVICLAIVTAPSGVVYSVRLLKNVWDCHRCVLTKRRLTEEYQVEDLDGAELPPRLPAEKVRELQALGLW